MSHRRFVGNSGLSYLWPLGGAIAWAATALLAVVVVRRRSGQLAAAIAGTFAGTYVGLYSTILPLALLPAFARREPRRALIVAALGIVALWSLYVAGALALVLVLLAPDRSSDGMVDSKGRPAIP